MSTALATTKLDEAIEQTLAMGDLRKLSATQRVAFYNATCRSLGLNPLTRPFEFIDLSGKLTMYAKRDCTDQLRRIHDVSLTIVSRETVDGIYIVTARATMPGGRTDESTGAVDIEGFKGEKRANAYMKAETKAKRRVTLSIVGLGILDESEVDSVPGARPVRVDAQTGEIAGEVVQTPSSPESAAAAENFAQAIADAQSAADLSEVAKAIGAAVKQGVLSPEDRALLAETFAARKAALAAPSAPEAAQ